MQQYPLFLHESEIGHVNVVRKGLYLEIVCVCREALPEDADIILAAEESNITLGKCYKGMTGCLLRRFIPAKEFGDGKLMFSIYDCINERSSAIRIDPEKPFNEIPHLLNARLCGESNGYSIVFD